MKHTIFQRELEQRKQQGLLRSRKVLKPLSSVRLLSDDKTLINFSSNDYLGLSSRNISPKKLNIGAFSSPLVTGRHDIHQEVEQNILNWLGAPHSFQCMLFSSGFSANQGVINGVFNIKRPDALLFQDKLNHASMIEAGIRVQALGHCQQVRFKHNDMAHLSVQLAKHSHNSSLKVIATESVFSMDGDKPDLSILDSIARDNDAYLLLDEAHAIGVFGTHGQGCLSQVNIELAPHHILVLPFGKGMGAQGAAVVADETVINYLVNFSKEYIYSTHISPLQVAAIQENLNCMISSPDLRDQLHKNIRYFKKEMATIGINTNSDSAIQPIILSDEKLAMRVATELQRAGIMCTAIRYPTVAKNAARLRVTVTARHTEQQIDLFVAHFKTVMDQLGAG